jgi:hypothetical protein
LYLRRAFDRDVVFDPVGNVSIWFMNASTVASIVTVGNVGANWQLQSLDAE